MSSNTPRVVRRAPTRASGLLLLVLTLALSALINTPRAAAADKVVGSGTAASCTEIGRAHV